METKENYYQGVDRTILIELKNVLRALEYKKTQGELTQIETAAYADLQELFSNSFQRPFFQGDNEFSLTNDLDSRLFMQSIYTTLRYLIVTTGISDSFLANRLQVIYDMNTKVEHSIERGEFADGHVVDVSKLSEEEFRRAAKEFSEGSMSLQDFLMYAHAQNISTLACCKGHSIKNGTKSTAYIAFSLNDEYDKKMFLMSKAFEAGIGIAIIDFDDGLGFNIMPNPYDRDAQITYLTQCLKEYKKDVKLNPVVEKVMGYMESIGHNAEEYSSIEFFSEDGIIGIEEHTPRNANLRGIFTEEVVLDAYSRGDSTILQTLPIVVKGKNVVNSRDTAKTALELTKKHPGRLSNAMKRTLQIFNRMIGRNKEEKSLDFQD